MNEHNQQPRPGDADAPMPRHVAIIMDGNGRWASSAACRARSGIASGVEAVRRTVRAAIELGVQYLTHLQLLVGELVAPGRARSTT